MNVEKRIIDILSGKQYVISVYKYGELDLEYYKSGKRIYNAKQLKRAENLLTYKRQNGHLAVIPASNDHKFVHRLHEYRPAHYRTPQKSIYR